MAYREQIRVVRERHTWWGRMLSTVRSYTIGPLTSRSPELARLFGGGGATTSGVHVTEETAMRLAAVWSAVSLISDDVASLPLNLFKKLPNGTKDKFEQHPLYRLLKDAPNPEMTSFTFRRTMQSNALIWNVAYAEIERDGAGRPVNLWPLLPEKMQQERVNGVLAFVYSNPTGRTTRFAQGDILQIMGPSWDGVAPMSFIDKARNSLALGLAAEDFGATFYKNGGTVSGVIAHKGPKPPQLSTDNKEDADARRHQGISRAFKWLQLWNDATFIPISTAPNNAQFLETRVFQIREVARWFKMPPHKLGDLADATYSNVEQLDLSYFKSCLRPWLINWEQELARKLIFPSEPNIQFFRHNLEGFLRADVAARSTFYKDLFGIGVLTINEIRELEDLDPINGGNESFVPMNNLMPLSKVSDYSQALIDRQNQPKAAPPPDQTPVIAELKALLEAAETRLVEYAERFAEQSSRLAVTESVAEERASAIASRLADIEQLRQLLAVAESGATDRGLAEVKRSLAEHEGQLLEHATKLAEELSLRVKAETLLGEREADVTGLISERDLLARCVEEGRAALETARAEREQAIQDVSAAGVDATRAADAKMAELSASLRALQDEKNDTDLMLGVAERDRDVARQAVTDAIGREAELSGELATLREAHVRAEAIVGELRTQIGEQSRKLEDNDVQMRESIRLGVEVNAANVELRAAGDAAAARALVAEQAVNEATKRLSAVRAAQRAVIVDTVERVIQREIDRARKAQSTPDKLQKWVETFYPVHAEVCRTAFRPVLEAWAASLGIDARPLIEREVSAHIAESTQGLRVIAQNEDDDARAAALERVLRRWEGERAAAVADRLLAEGEASCQTAA